MKIQCSCGAKYNLDVTPEMRGQPIQFVCSTCGRDASDYVTSLVGRELDLAGVPAASNAAMPAGYSNIAPPPRGYAPPTAVAAPAPVTVSEPPPPAPVAGGARLRIHAETQASAPASAAVEEPGETPRCLKHGGAVAHERCRVCSKPICPKCMELFGYVCSPLCKARAEAQHIDVPVFEGQRSVVEAKRARKGFLITMGVCSGVALLLGIWIWYEWFGSTPSKYYFVRFAEPAHSGETATGKDQLILLHGPVLARHDLKQKKEVWSRSLVDKAALEKEVADAIEANAKAAAKARADDPDNEPPPINSKEFLKSLEESAAAELQLRVVGQNIWVISPTKLTLYDWDSGQVSKEIGLTNNAGSVTHRGDEVVVLSGDGPQQHATYINLATKETREEDVTGMPTAPKNSRAAEIAAGGGGRAGRSQKGGGLPGLSGKDVDKPMDPAKVAADAQHLSIPGKAVLPAVLANSVHNQQIEKASRDGPDRQVAQNRLAPEEPFELVPTPDGFMRFTTKLLERNIVTRSAMKAPPSKSALSGDVNVTQTAAVANEILNEMQRNAGYDTVEVDESRYLVKLSSADGKNEWSGEVTGPPRLFALKTVNVLASNQKIMVFDKQNKKVWDAALTYDVVGGRREESDIADSGSGKGPCVERNGRLYVFDQGVLTAFDLASGNAAWRVPSVGITGLFFDDQEMLYVNTTDASPETIKYSRQIDVTRMPAGQLLKIHPKTGKILFKVSPPGPVTYVSGKFIYSVQSYTSFDEDSGDSILGMTGMGGSRPFIRIRRLKASNGKEMWEHYEQRGPLNVQFDKNQIRIVFKKEVEVLKFLSM